MFSLYVDGKSRNDGAAFLSNSGNIIAAFNPYLTNGFSHHYQLGESTFIFKGVRSDFLIFISFFDEIPPSKQNSSR